MKVTTACLSLLIQSAACLATDDREQTQQEAFISRVKLFAKASEIYLNSVGVEPIATVEANGRKALEVWGYIQSPSRDFPNTKEIRRIRVPTNNLAKLIGGQLLDISNEGYIIAERFQKGLAQSQLNALKRELK